MSTDARFAIKARDDLKHQLKRSLEEILQLKEEIKILRAALEEWRTADPGEMEYEPDSAEE